MFSQALLGQAKDTLRLIEAKIEVQTQYKNGAVELRWAPNAYYTFSVANRKGYAVERYNVATKKYERLATLKPYTLAEFKNKLDTTNLYVATAAQALWGKPAAPVKLNANPLEAAKAKADAQNNRFVFAMLAAEFNNQAAVGLALYYKDETALPNQIYAYRIFAVDVKKDLLRIDTAGASVNTFGAKKARPVEGVFAEAFDGKIKLQWPKSGNNDRYSGYYIERKTQGNYVRLNQRPHISSDANRESIFNVFVDTTIVNGQKYSYRVLGINSFAQVELPSIAITTQGTDLQGPIPPTGLKVNHLAGNEFTLTWEAITTQDDHKGFMIARADDGMGPFEMLTSKPISKKSRQWVDKTPPLINESYYLVYAVDDKGNRNASGVALGQWRDSIAPAKPTNLIGYSDSTGVVMLAWELGNEPDLYGYKVFAGNAKNRDFYQVNSLVIEGNIFLDKISLNTLTEEIYYYVTALDFRSNASVHSDTIKLAKPDIIPPTPIAFKRYQTASDSIYLSWAASSSKDVMAYYLLRKSPEEAKYTALKRLALNTTTYTDKAVKIGETYDYAVLTIDDAGLPSMPSAPLRLTCVDRGLRQGITDLAGELNTKEATFNLSWSAPVNKDATVVIYRNDNRKGLEVLTKIPATQTTYTDETLYNNGGQFDYAVKVLYPNGGESLLSNVVTLQLK